MEEASQAGSLQINNWWPSVFLEAGHCFRKYLVAPCTELLALIIGGSFCPKIELRTETSMPMGATRVLSSSHAACQGECFYCVCFLGFGATLSLHRVPYGARNESLSSHISLELASWSQDCSEKVPGFAGQANGIYLCKCHLYMCL